MSLSNLWNQLKKNKDIVYLIFVMAFFFFTMVFQLTHSALWGDEWVEYEYSQEPIRTGEWYQGVISTFQPPLYNFVMHFWLKVSKSILWFRFYNVVLGMIAGAFLYLTVKKLSNKYVGMVSVVVLAACYQWVYCIQECSEYATMLFFLFIGIWAYVECCETFKYWKMAIFILANVGAIYSQYGSVFVSLPLLLVFYLGVFFSKESTIKKKIIVTVSYLISLLVFALPLYIFFLKQQMEHNEISSHMVSLTFDLCKDIIFNLGRMIIYFFNLKASGAWEWLGGALTIMLMVMSVYLLVKEKLGWIKNSLIITTWIGYFIHFFLVQMHIYAMAHPNQSGGFYERYSYFYIPILAVVLPIIFYEMYNSGKDWQKKTLVFMGGAGILCLFLSFYTLLGNWDKAKDDQFAEIWIENRGWEDTTYLVGAAPYGFYYYVKQSEAYKEGYFKNACIVDEADDVKELPLAFWIWRTNWGGNIWQAVMDKANSLGYTVTVYEDFGTQGQLAYCEYMGAR